jgi:hypothetical protein
VAGGLSLLTVFSCASRRERQKRGERSNERRLRATCSDDAHYILLGCDVCGMWRYECMK